jgi:hypothetical protein
MQTGAMQQECAASIFMVKELSQESKQQAVFTLPNVCLAYFSTLKMEAVHSPKHR